ncbi:MAG: right-handed parallel beta-helix repeat-containing protein [Gemmatimonadales bacterium]
MKSQSQLEKAAATARPGDRIELADGWYVGGVMMTRSGSPAAPVTLHGGRRAIIDAGSMGRPAVSLKASHWVIRGISVTNGLFGVYVDGGSSNLLDSIEVFHIGQEGVTFADFSSDNVLSNSDIHDTGVSIPEYGEGVYIGSPIEHWAQVSCGQPDRSDRNQVLDNTIGPDVRAEQVDVKEGTSGGVIRGNRLDGRGMIQSQTWVDSWMEIKGNDYEIVGNHGSNAIRHGFETVVIERGWGNNNVFRGNVADVQAAGYGFKIGGGSGNIVYCNNEVRSAEAGFATVSCTP